MRSARELLDVSDPAWPQVRELIAHAPIDVAVLPAARDTGRVLHALQVSAASTLGALVASTGGVVCDHGWLRLLGGGTRELPSLVDANGLVGPQEGPPAFLTVAYDVLGGRFAINGGALTGDLGEVCYFGPDSLEWTAIGGGHTAFVHWVLDGGLTAFYRDLRWPGWERETAALGLDQGISTFPPPFAKEERDLATVSRRAVPIHELLDLYDDVARQLAGAPDGMTFKIKPTD